MEIDVKYCAQKFGIDSAKAEAMHLQYGSIFHGLVAQGLLSTEEDKAAFFQESFSSINVGELLSNR